MNENGKEQDYKAICDAIVKQYKEGIFINQLSMMYNMHTFKIAGILYANGIINTQGKKGGSLIKFSDEQIKEIIDQYKLGTNTTQIARLFNTSITKIYTVLKQNNIELNRQHDSEKLLKRKKMMYSMWLDGMTFQGIADQFGISRERVRQCIKYVDTLYDVDEITKTGEENEN